MASSEPASTVIKRRIQWVDTDASGWYHNTAALRLIEEVCMLDQLSGGRLELGLGRSLFGLIDRERHLEGLAARSRIRRWTGPVFIGSYGTGNYVVLTRQPSVLSDPRTRALWEDPLRPLR